MAMKHFTVQELALMTEKSVWTIYDFIKKEGMPAKKEKHFGKFKWTMPYRKTLRWLRENKLPLYNKVMNFIGKKVSKNGKVIGTFRPPADNREVRKLKLAFDVEKCPYTGCQVNCQKEKCPMWLNTMGCKGIAAATLQAQDAALFKNMLRDFLKDIEIHKAGQLIIVTKKARKEVKMPIKAIRATSFKQWLMANLDYNDIKNLAEQGAANEFPKLTYYQ